MVNVGKGEVRLWGSVVCDFTRLICVDDLSMYKCQV